MLGLASIPVIMTGCLKLLKDRDKDTVIAQVGDVKLMRSEVAKLYTGDDSLKLTQNFVNGWVMKQLKVHEAEKLMDKNGVDINSLVQDYRNSLLSQKLDQYYITMSVDTTITTQNVNEYYLEHKADFTLERPLIKGRIVRVPNNFRQSAKLKELMGSQSIEKRQDFEDMCIKNGFLLTIVDNWTEFQDFLNNMPVVKGGDYDYLLTTSGIKTMSDNEYDYFFEISNIIPAGNASPINMVESEIRRIIINRRGADIIKRREDSLYNTAVKNNSLVINF